MAGDFSLAGGSPANNIVSWNGLTYSTLNLGVDTTVWAILADSTGLYVGGEFLNASGMPVSHIAKWTPAPVSFKNNSHEETFKFFPNPTTGTINIVSGKVGNIFFSDISGRIVQIDSYQSNSSSQIDISSLPPGIYSISDKDGFLGKVVKLR